jgi:hypothetical protein
MRKPVVKRKKKFLTFEESRQEWSSAGFRGYRDGGDISGKISSENGIMKVRIGSPLDRMLRKSIKNLR